MGRVAVADADVTVRTDRREFRNSYVGLLVFFGISFESLGWKKKSLILVFAIHMSAQMDLFGNTQVP